MKLLTINTKNTILYGCISILCLLILTRDIGGLGIPNMLFAIIVIVAGLILKLDKFKLFLFFLFPFTCGVPGYTMLVSIIVLFLKSVGKVQVRSLQIYPIIFIALLELFDNFVSIGDIDISAYVSFLSFTAVFFFLLFDKSNYKQSRECLIAFMFGTAFVFIVIYSNMFLEFGIEMILGGQLRDHMGAIETEEVGKLILNANSLAYLSIILISVLLMGNNIINLSPFVYYPLFVLSILAGMGSFSRTWMALFVIVLVFYLSYKRSFRVLFSMIFLGAFFAILFPQILEGFTNVMTDRINDENLITAGSRTNVFAEYNTAWLENISYIIWGTGVTSYKKVIQASFSMHNSFQQIYVCLGIVGLFLYIIMFLNFFKTKVQGRILRLNYLPFCSAAIFLQTIQFLEPYYLMLPMIPACYAFLVRKPN